MRGKEEDGGEKRKKEKSVGNIYMCVLLVRASVVTINMTEICISGYFMCTHPRPVCDTHDRGCIGGHMIEALEGT